LASRPGQEEAFLREVDEELRRDELIKLWRRWGRVLVVLIVLGLAAFAGVLWWQQHKQTVAGTEGEKFNTAINSLADGKADAAKVPLAELAKSDSAGYRALAKISQANLLMQANDLKGAAAKFAEVTADTSLPQPYRDLALVRQTSVEYDSLKPEAVIARLRPLAIKGSPWFGSAGEMVAAAYLAQGKRAAAGALYGEIAKSTTVPETIRQRAVQMAGVLGVDAADALQKAEEKKPE